MPWSTSDRGQRLPSDWRLRRKSALSRAGYRCESPGCGAPAVDCDHIVRGDDHSLSNLQALCAWHHKRKTARESAEARKLARSERIRPEPPHPGLI